MLDIIHQAEKEDLEAVILSLDFVKCFDKCSFSILFGSLEYFKFGEIVKQWTKILYKDFTVKIQNNGHFSLPIDIKKGVHQGGCCSSIYFLVIAEILAISLRANEEIEGITLKDIRNLLNQFADDMDIFSLCKETSIRNIYNELEAFRLQSGFTVSYEKTTLYRIGSLRHSDAMLYNMNEFVWSNRDINVLGVTIAHENLVEKNYQGIIGKVKKNLFSWQNRGLSLIGKIQVVNTLIASLFVYKMMVLPIIPNNILRNIDNIIREFIWDGKKSKISYSTLQLPKKEGGLGLVMLKERDKALKATWPQILHTEKEYANLVYGIIRCTKLGNNIWRCNLNPEDVKYLRFNSTFWKDVLYSWCKYNYYQSSRIENQIIWYNSKIKIQGKLVMWNDSYSKGLVYVHQLFQQQTYKSDGQLQQEYGLSTLRVNSLKSAIPGEWKAFFVQNSKAQYLPLPPHIYDTSILSKHSFSKNVYTYFMEDITMVHNKYIKWRQELGYDFCDGLLGFRDQHKRIYKLTNITKYRSFQYRLLQRGLVTNIQLEKWNILPSRLCTFCHQEDETLNHMMWNCVEVRNLWEQVFKFLKQEYKIQELNINIGNIITCNVAKGQSIANFVCLITKQFIYCQRCRKSQLHFPILKAKIRSIENLEKYIAVKNSKLNIHLKKWRRENETPSIGSIDQYARQYVENM